MEMGGFGYEKPKLVEIAEKIYSCKSEKERLELELDTEKFHQRYIPQRKELIRERFFSHLPLVILLSLAVVVSFVMLTKAVVDSEFASGNTALILAALVLVFGGYADVKFIIMELHMLTLLRISVNDERALRYAAKHDINTFQNDEIRSKEKIELLEGQIAALDRKLVELAAEQKQFMEEQRAAESAAKRVGQGKPAAEKEDSASEVAGGFSLKAESVGSQDALMLHEYYCNEEIYIQGKLLELEARVEKTNKEIVEIDDNIQTIKTQLLIAIIVYVLIAIVQSAFSGMLSLITSVLCVSFSLSYVFYFERKCMRPILLYLVEHDSKLVAEYAFCNDMVPVRNKRQELLEMIEQNKRELEEIKRKKQEIVF
ncbi:MAG: hypothetical protein NC124_00575 [Clostridium sp.]|nr:hypothetical protein [Clostridium sp.]